MSQFSEVLSPSLSDYAAVTIRLASPEDIRAWSFGEVRKPETINYRTYRSEKDGLFCEKIFGPEKDWECFCGKYKGIKHKGITCERCGVTVTHSKVRRKRMGHIFLAAPVAHIWFFKAMPSRMGTLLAMKNSALERVIYFQDYVVVDPGDTDLREKQLLTEEQFKECREKYGDRFRAGMGAEAIKQLLMRLDLPQLSEFLRKELKTTKSKQKQADYIKRLKIVEAILGSDNKPEWMVLDIIPVIPPDLRPLVLLESGNFATSDLNDLYRRLINRNNRLKKLLDLNAPEVIIRNEKRMLQQSVDALFDNSRCRRPVLGSSNRPLKSLTDMIKGKQGRFRDNLLGKRVDYSARSVIVVGPDLKLHQCGLPKKIALELFQPFIIRRLKEIGLADTIKSAKKMLERKDEEVWDILEEVIHDHPVLLNRAPTLHRIGIQAFEPVLIEGNAIKLHPLVCAGFNADFDGDQMAVHLPLSIEAQIEATTLMMSTNNIFSPQNGTPITAPSQDIVLGMAYLTVDRPGRMGEGKVFSDQIEVFAAYAHGRVDVHARIKVRMPKGKIIIDEKGEHENDGTPIETTPGRVVANDILPPEMAFYNLALDKGVIKRIIDDSYRIAGKQKTLYLLDGLKELGFKAATRAGLSISKNDLIIPEAKEKILSDADVRVRAKLEEYESGVITDQERYNSVIDIWTHARELVGKEMMKALAEDTRAGALYLNPVNLMVKSGARGSVEQVRQLAGMRGLMAKPSGEIIETPIRANFREGLHVLEYFSSTHGARKGLADTALKTADSGYLTRKLADVAQNVVINLPDCRTLAGVDKRAPKPGDEHGVSLAEQIYGRSILGSIKDPITGDLVAKEGQMLDKATARRIEGLGFDKITVRSPLTCEAPLGSCARCYGADLSTGELAEPGLAVGIIAAQSIGEPGTQLTMRTFHTGGVAMGAVADPRHRAPRAGSVAFRGIEVVKNKKGDHINLATRGEIWVEYTKGEPDRFEVPMGAIVNVEDGEKVKARKQLCEWDQHSAPILAASQGIVSYIDLKKEVTIREEVDVGSKQKRFLVIEHKGNLHPQLVIKSKDGTPIEAHPIPEKAYIEVREGEIVTPGTILAKTPRGTGGTQDITGGLPRVQEIFEARRPKDPAVMAQIDGTIEIQEEKKRNKRVINIRNPKTDEVVQHLLPQGKILKVRTGDFVKEGTPTCDGPLVPQEILEISGREALQEYLLREVQNVYRSQGVNINDKHIEIIISQMLRKVQVDDPGGTDLLPGLTVDRFVFERENRRAQKARKKPASFRPVLLGITKASLQSESFISSASFQETTKVLTEAALAGRTDYLLGLKENVIIGNKVPDGTGFKPYRDGEVKKKLEILQDTVSAT